MIQTARPSLRVLPIIAADDLRTLWQAFRDDAMAPFYWGAHLPEALPEVIDYLFAEPQQRQALFAYDGPEAVAFCFVTDLLWHDERPARGTVCLYVRPEARRQAAPIWRAMTANLQVIGLRYLYAVILPANRRSRHLARAMGFQRMGTLPAYATVQGELHDGWFYALRLQELR